MAKVTVTVTEDMVSEEYRWLLPSVVPYMDLIIRAFLRARTQVEYGDMLSAPDGFASRENLNRILDKRMRIVAASPTPPLAADHRWGFVRPDPRATVERLTAIRPLSQGQAPCPHLESWPSSLQSIEAHRPLSRGRCRRRCRPTSS